MSRNDIDIKKRVEKAASINVGASFLTVPQAMRAAGFTDAESKNPTLQQRVRRTIKDKLEKDNTTQDLAQQTRRFTIKEWTAEDEERLQSLQSNNITLDDTAVGRKRVLFEQQMIAASINMSEDMWDRCVEMRKRKLEFVEVGGEHEMATAGRRLEMVDKLGLKLVPSTSRTLTSTFAFVLMTNSGGDRTWRRLAGLIARRRWSRRKNGD
ncbi:hypothetical protein ACHAXA_006142 [Cyclostephanos tholiformis]|uniref:Uncharacterized protein n=1 Tax=Cyclostephanos tholiformis TaxID=382380 RepID=A0ABD3R261_9STRA